MMYFMDPERGRTRRAQMQDKFTGLSNDLQRSIEGKSKDFGNRAKGLLHDAKSKFGGSRASDDFGDMSTEREGMGI